MVINRPNWLGSEVGLELKTAGISTATTITPVPVQETIGNFTQLVARSGSFVDTPNVKGILFQDVDVLGSTATEQIEAPIMIGGRYLAGKLQTGAEAAVVSLAEPKLRPFNEGAVTRPDFGTLPANPFI
jgi:hypothetical protein